MKRSRRPASEFRLFAGALHSPAPQSYIEVSCLTARTPGSISPDVNPS